MPHINPFNTSLYSSGQMGENGIVSINRVNFIGPSAYGPAEWYSEDKFITGLHEFKGDWVDEIRLILVEYPSGSRTNLLVDGFSGVFAGGGRWATYSNHHGIVIDGITAHVGDKLGSFPDESTYDTWRPAVHCFGPDGTLAWFPWYRQGLVIQNPITRNHTILSRGPVEDVHILDKDKILWREGNKIFTYGLPDVKTIPGPFNFCRGLIWEDKFYVLYFHYQLYKVVLHPCDSFVGYSLGPGLCWRPDIAIKNGLPYAVWSKVDRDQRDDIVSFDFSTDVATLQDLSLLLNPPVPPIPIPPKEPPPKEPPPKEPPKEPPPKPKEDIEDIQPLIPVEARMNPVTVVIRGNAGKLLRPGTKRDEYGRLNVVYTDTEVTEDNKFELSKPDSLYAVKHIKTGEYLGFDATQYSGDLTTQLYLIANRGAYESPFVGKALGMIMAVVGQSTKDLGGYFTTNVTLERV